MASTIKPEGQSATITTKPTWMEKFGAAVDSLAARVSQATSLPLNSNIEIGGPTNFRPATHESIHTLARYENEGNLIPVNGASSSSASSGSSSPDSTPALSSSPEISSDIEIFLQDGASHKKFEGFSEIITSNPQIAKSVENYRAQIDLFLKAISLYLSELHRGQYSNEVGEDGPFRVQGAPINGVNSKEAFGELIRNLDLNSVDKVLELPRGHEMKRYITDLIKNTEFYHLLSIQFGSLEEAQKFNKIASEGTEEEKEALIEILRNRVKGNPNYETQKAFYLALLATHETNEKFQHHMHVDNLTVSPGGNALFSQLEKTGAKPDVQELKPLTKFVIENARAIFEIENENDPNGKLEEKESASPPPIPPRDIEE